MATQHHKPFDTPSQAVARHFADRTVNVEALKAAKQRALHARERMAKYPKKGEVRK